MSALRWLAQEAFAIAIHKWDPRLRPLTSEVQVVDGAGIYSCTYVCNRGILQGSVVFGDGRASVSLETLETPDRRTRIPLHVWTLHRDVDWSFRMMHPQAAEAA